MCSNRCSNLNERRNKEKRKKRIDEDEDFGL